MLKFQLATPCDYNWHGQEILVSYLKQACFPPLLLTPLPLLASFRVGCWCFKVINDHCVLCQGRQIITTLCVAHLRHLAGHLALRLWAFLGFCAFPVAFGCLADIGAFQAWAASLTIWRFANRLATGTVSARTTFFRALYLAARLATVQLASCLEHGRAAQAWTARLAHRLQAFWLTRFFTHRTGALPGALRHAAVGSLTWLRRLFRLSFVTWLGRL